MKYYKLLTKIGYSDSCFIIDKIYPEIFKQNENDDQLSVLEMQQAYPNDWQEVPAGDYFVQEGKMPEYFAIKRVANDPLWQKYINWFRKKYNHFFDGTGSWYGFDGSTTYFDMFCSSLDKFKNTPVELTLEQWNQIVNKNKMEEFKLPENWYIDVTDDNVDMLNKWYKNEYFTSTNEYLVGMSKWNDGGTKKGHNPKGITKGKTYDFGTKITTEQFIKYVLKEDVMKENDKEIIGWKLKDDYEQYKQAALTICNTTVNWENSLMPYDIRIKQTGYISKLEKAGVLELWFEPVYSQKFKVGDWVTVEKYPGYWASLLNENCPENVKYPLIGQITKMQDYNSYIGIELCNYGFDLTSLLQKNLIKLATSEEIKAAQTPQITIKGYKGEFFDWEVKFGCQKFTPEFVIRLFELQNDFKIDLSSYNEEIKQIAEYYLNKQIAEYYLNKK